MKKEIWNVTVKRGTDKWSGPIICPTYKIAMKALRYDERMSKYDTRPYTIEIRHGITRRGKLIKKVKK